MDELKQGMQEPVPQKTIEFSPNKAYVWQPTEVFPLKGVDLHVLRQVLFATLQTEEAQRSIATYEAMKLVDNIIKEGVENGKIVEAPKAEATDTAK